MTDQDKQYIIDNAKTTTVADMAKHLRRAKTTICEFMRAEGISRSNTPKPVYDHPIRQRNRQLREFIDTREEKRKMAIDNKMKARNWVRLKDTAIKCLSGYLQNGVTSRNRLPLVRRNIIAQNDSGGYELTEVGVATVKHYFPLFHFHGLIK